MSYVAPARPVDPFYEGISAPYDLPSGQMQSPQVDSFELSQCDDPADCICKEPTKKRASKKRSSSTRKSSSTRIPPPPPRVPTHPKDDCKVEVWEEFCIEEEVVIERGGRGCLPPCPPPPAIELCPPPVVCEPCPPPMIYEPCPPAFIAEPCPPPMFVEVAPPPVVIEVCPPPVAIIIEGGMGYV